MGSKVFSIQDLDPDIDKAFIDLHAAFLSNRPYNIADFHEVALEFLAKTSADPSIHNTFFENFTIIWRSFLESGRLDEAESLWETALRPALAVEGQHPGTFIHKGTPFYFWGMTAILKGDLDRGYVLMHQAVEEDVRTTGNQLPETPALAFATLNYAKVDQAFRGWLLLQAQFLNRLLTEYSSSYGGHLTLEEFRSRFLLKPPSRDTVSLFAYTLARLFRLDTVPQYALASAFASQLEMNLLFDVTLVISVAIQAHNHNQWQFIDHAYYLSQRGNLGLERDQLSDINGGFNNDFDSTLKALLNGLYRLHNGTGLSVKQRDLAIAYGIRNRGAHNVSSTTTIWTRFEDIRQSLFNTLFLCVEVLY